MSVPRIVPKVSIFIDISQFLFRNLSIILNFALMGLRCSNKYVLNNARAERGSQRREKIFKRKFHNHNEYYWITYKNSLQR